MARTAPGGVVDGAHARGLAFSGGRRTWAFLLRAWCVAVGLSTVMSAQEPVAPQRVDEVKLHAAIDTLGSLDYDTRTNASRLIRRTPGAQAVPALLDTVSGHADGYVRYRALVLLTGFDDPRTIDAMRASLTSPNDRLRAVAYSYFEHAPDASVLPALLEALEREQAEFVRPALVRSLAAQGGDPRVQSTLIREVGRGEDFFRSTVIEALGDHRATYAYDAVTAVAKLDGPLLDDAALSLGKLGDPRALETLPGLQRTAPREAQPFVAAAICLLGTNCGSHESYLVQTLKFADNTIGYQELLRGAASGLGALGVSGQDSAVRALFEVGIPARDPARSPIALALGTVALRNTPLMLDVLRGFAQRESAIALLAEGFDMLEEDLDKERFFATVRHAYWSAPEGASDRALMQTLIGKLDF